MEIFSSRLRDTRGMTSQKAFAAKLGLSQQTYGHYEKGDREPGLETLQRIGVVCGVSIDWLLGLSERPSQITQRATANGPGGQAVALAHGNVVISPGRVEAMDCSTCKYRRLAEVIKAAL